MAITDPVADFLTRIRNATRAKNRHVDMHWSKMNESIANILKNEGFIQNFLVKKENTQRGVIRIILKYSEGRKSVINGLRRISRPGLRKYVGYDNIPSFYGSLGLAILSTSQGVISGLEAGNKKIGGELLCLVW